MYDTTYVANVLIEVADTLPHLAIFGAIPRQSIRQSNLIFAVHNEPVVYLAACYKVFEGGSVPEMVSVALGMCRLQGYDKPVVVPLYCDGAGIASDQAIAASRGLDALIKVEDVGWAESLLDFFASLSAHIRNEPLHTTTDDDDEYHGTCDGFSNEDVWRVAGECLRFRWELNSSGILDVHILNPDMQRHSAWRFLSTTTRNKK